MFTSKELRFVETGLSMRNGLFLLYIFYTGQVFYDIFIISIYIYVAFRF